MQTNAHRETIRFDDVWFEYSFNSQMFEQKLVYQTNEEDEKKC